MTSKVSICLPFLTALLSSGLSPLATQLAATLATPVVGSNDSLLSWVSVSASVTLLESNYQFDQVFKLTPSLQEYTEFVRIENLFWKIKCS